MVEFVYLFILTAARCRQIVCTQRVSSWKQRQKTILASADDDTITLDVNASNVETVSATGSEGKTVKEMFDGAMNYFFENNLSPVGGFIWSVPESSPAFLGDVCGMQDALSETVRHCGSAGWSEDDLFAYFVNIVGANWWVFAVCGFDHSSISFLNERTK